MTIKSIKFNDTKDEDIRILNFIENKNFNGLVKGLLLEYIERQNQPMRIVQKSAKGGIKYVVGK